MTNIASMNINESCTQVIVELFSSDAIRVAPKPSAERATANTMALEKSVENPLIYLNVIGCGNKSCVAINSISLYYHSTFFLLGGVTCWFFCAMINRVFRSPAFLGYVTRDARRQFANTLLQPENSLLRYSLICDKNVIVHFFVLLIPEWICNEIKM